MKPKNVLIALLCALALSGCATTDLSYSSDGTVSWSSKTLWKDVEDVAVEWGEFNATLGGSGGNGNEALIACIIAPHLEGCPK